MEFLKVDILMGEKIVIKGIKMGKRIYYMDFKFLYGNIWIYNFLDINI